MIRGPCLDAGLTKDWSLNLVSALAHLHGLGIVHSDVKPASMLVRFDVGPSRPGGYMNAVLKLVDFGRACKMPRAIAMSLIANSSCFVEVSTNTVQCLQTPL